VRYIEVRTEAASGSPLLFNEAINDVDWSLH
jgi:hypothetical protein